MCCQKVLEQLSVLADLRMVREGPAVHQHMVSQLKAVCKCWAEGHLVWGPLLAYAYIMGHPIRMQNSDNPMQEAGAFSGCLSTRKHMFLSVWDFLASAERPDVTMSGQPPSWKPSPCNFREAFPMPVSTSDWDHYAHVAVGLRGMQNMLQELGVWHKHVHDVSTSQVLKPASARDANMALLMKYWSKAGLANFRCTDGCTTKIATLMDTHPFIMMGEEAIPATDDKFFMEVAEQHVSYFLQCKLQYLWVFIRFMGEHGVELQMLKVSGHIDGTVFTPNPNAEKRMIGYSTLDGASPYKQKA